MATIGLYHIDLWHRGGAVPNIELMKIYNYHLQQNNKVIMMTPKDNINRFDHIYYFKESLAMFSKALEIPSDATTIGYGFYKKTDKLKPKIFNQPLNYSPYDIYTDKLQYKANYNSFKLNSYIRVETEDFTDYKPDKPIIYIVDPDFCHCAAALNFLDTYKRHSYHFLKPLRLKCNELEPFLPYTNIINNKFELLDFDIETFISNANETKLQFPLKRRPKETDNEYIARLIKIGLIFKNKGGGNSSSQSTYENTTPIERKIIKWINSSKIRISLQKCYLNDEEMQPLFGFNSPTVIRTLSKTNPLTINPRELDLY